MSGFEQWRFYETSTGGRLVRDELADLPEHAKAEMAALMKRYLRRPDEILRREVEPLGSGLFALRVSLAHNEFRCIFAHDGKFGQILLALAPIVHEKS